MEKQNHQAGRGAPDYHPCAGDIGGGIKARCTPRPHFPVAAQFDVAPDNAFQRVFGAVWYREAGPLAEAFSDNVQAPYPRITVRGTVLPDAPPQCKCDVGQLFVLRQQADWWGVAGVGGRREIRNNTAAKV